MGAGETGRGRYTYGEAAFRSRRREDGQGGWGSCRRVLVGWPPPAVERLARLGDQPGILAFTEKIFCVLGVVCLYCFAWAAMVSGALGCVGTVMRSV